jgi:hypothetical protein
MRLRQGIAAVLTACLLAALASVAHGAGEPDFGCRKVHRSKPVVNPAGKGRAPILIGDSTVLLPIPNLAQGGISVNGRGCRGFRESLNVAAKLRAKHHLPHLVLMNGYANGGAGSKLIADALSVIPKSHVLGLVTEYNADTGHPPAPDTEVLFRAARQYPRRIFVLDWVHFSRAHHTVEPAPGAWFLPDLYHPNYLGAAAYAFFLARALPLAKAGHFPPL